MKIKEFGVQAVNALIFNQPREEAARTILRLCRLTLLSSVSVTLALAMVQVDAPLFDVYEWPNNARALLSAATLSFILMYAIQAINRKPGWEKPAEPDTDTSHPGPMTAGKLTTMFIGIIMGRAIAGAGAALHWYPGEPEDLTVISVLNLAHLTARFVSVNAGAIVAAAWSIAGLSILKRLVNPDRGGGPGPDEELAPVLIHRD